MADLVTTLKALTEHDNAYLVYAQPGSSVLENLGKFVSLRACLDWIQRLPRRDWVPQHLVRLQTIFATLLSRATTCEQRAQTLVVGCSKAHPKVGTRLDLAHAMESALDIEVLLLNHNDEEIVVTITQLLTDDLPWIEFQRFWRLQTSWHVPTVKPKAPVAEDSPIAKSAAPVETATPTAEESKSAMSMVAPPETVAPIAEETKSAAPEAWLRLRACKRVAFSLRCPQPFVDWASGQTFAGVELDWVECNPRVAQETMQATPLVGDRWSARQTQLGVGDSFADDSRSTYGFVCADFQLPRYVAAVEAAWRARQPQHLYALAPLYAVGKFKIQAIVVAPLLVVFGETPSEWLEWHPDLGKAPEFRDRDSTAWLAELHKLIKDKAPLDRVRVVVE